MQLTPELSTLGRYQIRRILGRGAMGVVYEGFDTTLGRRVAIKTILKNAEVDADTRNDYAIRFVKEAKAVARLNHPNIVQVHDYGEENDVAYLVMEFVEGRELRGYFQENMPFEIGEGIRITCELLDALAFAHDAGVIHRDVKPANVMLDKHMHAKLADFGVARIQESSEGSQTSTMVGTPAFMSPEQIIGGRIDQRSDLFSAGMILYQFLTGVQPFKGAGKWMTTKKIMEEDPPKPSSVAVNAAPEFDQIVAKALAKDPEDRFPNALEFAAALRGTLATTQRNAIHHAPLLARTEKGGTEAEVEFWRSIQNSTDPGEFQLYLDRFPIGFYASLAKHKLSKLQKLDTATTRERIATEEKARAEAEARRIEQEAAAERERLAAEAKARAEAEVRLPLKNVVLSRVIL